MNRLAAGIDVGGTKCLGVLVDEAGTVLTEVRRPTPGTADDLVDTLVAIAADLVRGRDDAGDVTLGIGLPGLVHRDGVLVAAPHLPEVHDLDLRRELATRAGRRVWVDNDNTVAGLAEWQVGAGRGTSDLLFVGFGTGIGGLAICGGRPVRGAHGFAGEFGHIVVDPNGPPCPCGRRGCWERRASGSGLAELAREATAAGLLSGPSFVAGDAITGHGVRDAAIRGHAGALAVIDDLAVWMALGLVNLVNAFDPELIVLGGGLAADPDLYLGRVERAIQRQLFAADHRDPPRLAIAALGERAAAIGAALLPSVAAV